MLSFMIRKHWRLLHESQPEFINQRALGASLFILRLRFVLISGLIESRYSWFQFMWTFKTYGINFLLFLDCCVIRKLMHTIWRLEIMFQENDQESGKEYSTTVQIIIKDDCKKVIAWRTVSCKMTCYHVSDKKKNV